MLFLSFQILNSVGNITQLVCEGPSIPYHEPLQKWPQGEGDHLANRSLLGRCMKGRGWGRGSASLLDSPNPLPSLFLPHASLHASKIQFSALSVYWSVYGILNFPTKLKGKNGFVF